MDKERRDDLRRQVANQKPDTYARSSITASEFRALLDRDEALERAQGVVDDLKHDPDPDVRDVGYDIGRAISGDGGKEGRRDPAALTRLRYRWKQWRDMPALLNRRASVEQRLFDAASGKNPLPDADECRRLALKLGTPE